jgi:NhaP-type Na+/H+ or K+/H+ antiporter
VLSEADVTANEILIGVGLILVLAVGSQVLASRLRIPAIIVLLPAGFVAGALTTDVDPQRLLGPAFQPLVSLSVAVILYDAGLGLDLRKLKGHTRKVVIRLIVLGVLVTWAVAASLAAPLFGMSRGAAVMLGIILVVSGPTVSAGSSARWCSTLSSRAPTGDWAASSGNLRSASPLAWPAG